MSDWIDITDPSNWSAKLSTQSNPGDCAAAFDAPASSVNVFTWDGTQWNPPTTIYDSSVPVLQYIGPNAESCTGIRVTMKIADDEELGGGGTFVDDFVVAFDYAESGETSQPWLSFVVQRCQYNDDGLYPADTIVIVEAQGEIVGSCSPSVTDYLPDYERALLGITATHMTRDVDNCGPNLVFVSSDHVSVQIITKIEAMFDIVPAFWTGFDGTEER